MNADDEPPPAPSEVQTQQSTIDSLDEKLNDYDGEEEDGKDKETPEDGIENLDDEPSPENAEDEEDDEKEDDDEDDDKEDEDMDEDA